MTEVTVTQFDGFVLIPVGYLGHTLLFSLISMSCYKRKDEGNEFKWESFARIHIEKVILSLQMHFLKFSHAYHIANTQSLYFNCKASQ